MKSFEDLCQTIDRYMKYYINGDNFGNEPDFEDEIREMLMNNGFKVLPKACVKNVQQMVEGLYSDVERQIPDITVNCAEGQAFLELKFCNDNSAYESDVLKVQNYLAEGECQAVGVLFLDDEKEEWEPCLANSIYTYCWEFAE